jgi:phosphate transport system permease protein
MTASMEIDERVAARLHEEFATEPVPRKVRSLTGDDVLAAIGAVVSSFSLVFIGYLHLLDWSGWVGFGVCWYLAFIVLYALVLYVGNPGYMVADRLVAATVLLLATLVIAALVSTVVYTFIQGWHALAHSSFYTHNMAGVSPTAPLGQGGLYHALVGTLIEVGIAVAVSIPLGIGTAVYMTEVGGPLANTVRTVVEAMTALPEILAGLFVYVVLIVGFGMSKSGIAVSAAMAVTMIPIMARASEVALRVVPGGLREASSALGAPQWRTVSKVVLPAARTGLVTAIILAIARGVGETAIPLICSGASSFTTYNPFGVPMNSLPLYIYTSYISHEPTQINRAFGAASVLLALVLILFGIARFLVREKSPKR